MKHTQREKQQAKRTLHHQLQMSQVRRGDQPRYPHLLWPLRWTIAHSKRMVPLLTKKRLVTGHSVTPHTHTHTHTHTRAHANRDLGPGFCFWGLFKTGPLFRRKKTNRHSTKHAQKIRCPAPTPHVTVGVQNFLGSSGTLQPPVGKARTRESGLVWVNYPKKNSKCACVCGHPNCFRLGHDSLEGLQRVGLARDAWHRS